MYYQHVSSDVRTTAFILPLPSPPTARLTLGHCFHHNSVTAAPICLIPVAVDRGHKDAAVGMTSAMNTQELVEQCSATSGSLTEGLSFITRSILYLTGLAFMENCLSLGGGAFPVRVQARPLAAI